MVLTYSGNNGNSGNNTVTMVAASFFHFMLAQGTQRTIRFQLADTSNCAWY
jgi:hypothetical protein